MREYAQAYYDFLMTIHWDNPLYMVGINEGKTKFLSNMMVNSKRGSRHLYGDYYTSLAAEKVKNKDYKGLVFEHIVPKTKYILRPCEERARNGTLTVDFIEDLLNRYYKIAIVTVEEDKQLNTNSMPDDWDGVNIFSRYEEVGIELLEKTCLQE
jgi:hypothetical protein